MDRAQTNWEDQLREDEVGESEEGKRVVYLVGLQRLAREAGIVESYPLKLDMTEAKDGSLITYCIYQTVFSDGSKWGGAADVNHKNVKAPFSDYPVAVAESRAEARSLKKALGIKMLAAEEIIGGVKISGSSKKKIDKNVVRAIQASLEEVGVAPLVVLKKVLTSSRFKEVADLDELTAAEGVEVLSALDKEKKGKK